jgi:hypothetical protein
MKNILEIGDEGKFAPKGKNVRIIRLSNKIVTFLDLSDNKEKSIWKDSFYNRFTKESVDETIDKVLKDRDIEFKKEPTTTNKEEKKSKEDYTLVGIYNDESGVKETEDLTNKDIKGYRIRYNNKQWANYSFGRIIYSLEELENAKKQLEKANDEAAKDKEYKKQKETENKIKRLERSKEEAFKLEQAKQDILKKDAYLMEESEYQDKVVPILKEYSKFVNKNKEYLASLGYDTIIYLTFEEILDKNLQGISVGRRYYASKDIEDQKKLTTENWNYEKFGYKGKEEKGTPDPTPKNIIDTNKDYINKLSNFFSNKLIYNGLNKTILKSNKWNVKEAIEDDTYKNMLENETLTEEKLEKIAKSVDVRVPKKVFSDSVIKSRENEKKMNEILKNIPVQNKEKLYELISSVEESFKPLEKQVFEKEKARYIELLNSYVNKDVVSLPVLENVPFWAAALNYESSFSEKKIVSVYKDKYEKDQEVVEYVQKYKGLTLKLNFESIVNRYVLDVVEGLKVKFVEAVLVNFKRITLKMVGFKVLKLSAGYKGFEGEYRFNFINGSSFDFLTQAIGAGGYNIQRYHFRYLSSFNNIVLSDGTKVPNSYYEILTHFSEKMEAGGMVEKPEIVCLKCGWNWKQESSSIKEMYKCHNCGFDLLKEPSSLFKISKIHKTSVSELEKQLNKGIKVEKEHTNHKHVAKIIALHHLEEDPNYYDKLEKVEGHKMADGGLIYKKIYNRAGGGYTTIINGMLYNINKQYDKGTWVAQSDDGEYYKETQTLAELKDYLKHLNKKNTMADGGDTESLFYHGYKIGDDGMYKQMNTTHNSDSIKDFDKVKNDLIKKVDVLIAKKKKLYSNVDITTPMSADEKKLDKDIAYIFSQIQQLIQQKRSLKTKSTFLELDTMAMGGVAYDEQEWKKTEEQYELQRLQEDAYRAQRHISQVSIYEVDKAIEEFYQVRQVLRDFEQAIEDREDNKRRDININNLIEDEIEDEKKQGDRYEYKDLFKKSPALAALQSLKNMIEWVQSEDSKDYDRKAGWSEEKIEENVNRMVDNYSQSIKDLEYHIGLKKSKSKKLAEGGEMEKVGLLAPNGKKSNLTLEQYKLVRTPEFKAWFGDWENDPENASKVLDENGEPLVVYHGTNNGKFNVFDNEKTIDKTFYFTDSKSYAIRYSHDNPNFGKPTINSYVFEVFLNLKNPLMGYITDFKNYGNNDGSMLTDGRYVVLNSNQVKLADGTNTKFDINNQDIRYENGGLIIAYEVVYEKLVDGEKERDIKIFKTKEEAERFAKENYGFVENVYDGQYEYANGGEIDPDNKAIKSAMTHKAGSAGGLLVGNRHSEGGIKAINKSSNSPIEMEGGEVVITRNAVSDNQKREFEGQMMTNREILSKINESGGGVSFASGGDVPSSCKCSGKSYKYGGKMVSDFDIINDININ